MRGGDGAAVTAGGRGAESPHQRRKAHSGKPASRMKTNFLRRKSENLDGQGSSRGKESPSPATRKRPECVAAEIQSETGVINVAMGPRRSRHKFLPGIRAGASRLSASRSPLQGGTSARPDL